MQLYHEQVDRMTQIRKPHHHNMLDACRSVKQLVTVPIANDTETVRQENIKHNSVNMRL